MTITPIVIIALLFSLCLGAIIVYIALLSRHRKTGMGKLNVLGMSARVKSTLRPEGSIILDGELWRARLNRVESEVAPGNAVRIVGASGHVLLVEPLD